MDRIDERLAMIDGIFKTKNLTPDEQGKLQAYQNYLKTQKKEREMNRMLNLLIDQALQRNENPIFGERQRIGPGGPPIPGRINPMTNIREFLPNRMFGDRIKIHPGNIYRPSSGKL